MIGSIRVTEGHSALKLTKSEMPQFGLTAGRFPDDAPHTAGVVI